MGWMLWLAVAALIIWWSEKRYRRRKQKRMAMKRILGN